MTVEPSVFVGAMRAHWTDTLQNISSAALEAVWHQMAFTFNHQIATFGTPAADRWRILQPTTGTGKSQGLAVYCSLLPDHGHPGVLIVTRLKTQADEIAATINTLAGRDVALAYHSDSRVPVEVFQRSPVLVITHRAYEIGLDAVTKADACIPNAADHGFVEEQGYVDPNPIRATAASWERLHQWTLGRRKLTVIDEALDIIEEAQIDLKRVSQVRGLIPFAIAEKHPAQMKVIEMMEGYLKNLARTVDERNAPRSERLVSAKSLPGLVDMTPLRQAMKSVRLDFDLLNKNDPDDNKRIVHQCDTILRDIQSTLENWHWYAMKLQQHTLNTARCLIVPDDINGAVVLDATASSNLIYTLFGDRAEIVPVPANARSYANVTLHVSTGHAVGKTTLLKKIKEEGPKLISNLQREIAPRRKVFVCCHKFVKPHIAVYDTGFDRFDVGHWGAVDGENRWKDFDTAVIFGLPYRDRTWSANTFMALQGPQATEWLTAEGDRPFQRYKDIRHALEVGQLVVNLVQAMNRTRNRKVIDAHGNCPPADIFLLLPGDDTGKEVLEGIRREMPGLNVVNWSYSEARRKPRRSNFEDALVHYGDVMVAGVKSASDVRSELGIPQRTWFRLVEKMQDHASAICNRLASLGVSYEVKRQGSRNVGHLAKAG